MTRLLQTLACGLLLVAGAAPAGAVPGGSITCKHATRADETTICADPSLIQLDYRMTRLYKTATVTAGMGSRGDIKNGQAEWLVKRQACKADVDCLRAAYTGRIETLKALVDDLAKHNE